MRYVPACKKAKDVSSNISDDPMTQHYGVDVGEIMEDWMSRHIKKCEKCREASIEASMP